MDNGKSNGAMANELESLNQNKIWGISVALSHYIRRVATKWVFTIKHKDDRNIQRYKAHLATKSFTQVPDHDYNRSFCHAMQQGLIRTLFAIGVH